MKNKRAKAEERMMILVLFIKGRAPENRCPETSLPNHALAI